MAFNPQLQNGKCAFFIIDIALLYLCFGGQGCPQSFSQYLDPLFKL